MKERFKNFIEDNITKRLKKDKTRKEFLLCTISIVVIILIVSLFCSFVLYYGYLGLSGLVVPVYFIGVLLCSLIAWYLSC